MDESELVKATKNSLKASKSDAEILEGFQSRGFKLEYAQKLLQKAKRPKKILVVSLLALFVCSVFAVALFTTTNHEKDQVTGLASLQKITGNTLKENPQIIVNQKQQQQQEEIFEEVEVTSVLITELLAAIGASSLHKNYLTFKDPIINFLVGDQSFHAIIKKNIQTRPGLHENPDLQFTTQNVVVARAVSSSDPKQALRESIRSGQTKITVYASKADLFAKGYMQLYDSLK